LAVTQAVPKEVAFETLYLRLRQEGFRTGIDQQLRMQELLDRMRCSPEDLKTVLCPLFATSPTQQAIFYRVFDEVFPVLGASAPAPAQDAVAQTLGVVQTAAGTGSASDSHRRLRRAVWVPALSVILGAGILFLAFWHPLRPPQPRPPAPPSRAQVEVRGFQTVNLVLPAAVPTIHPEAKQIAFEWSLILTPFLMLGALVAYRQWRKRISTDRQAKLQEPHFWCVFRGM
jgi:hypothetical protein